MYDSSPSTPSDFREVCPGPLAPWVRQVWYSRGSLEHLREIVLPSADTDIVANLGPSMRLVEGDGVERIVGTTVTGLLTRRILLEHPPVHEALGIRLTVHGIRAVLGIPAAAVRDLVVDLPDVLERPVDELVERCRDREGAEAKLRAAVDWITERVARFAGTGDRVAREAAIRIEASRGRIGISTLQAASGFGATRFRQRFVDEVGVTPKTYARLVRFRGALDGLRPATPLSSLAFELGYADQAHMHRDFRNFGRTTPLEVLAKRYPSGTTLAAEGRG